MWVGHGKRRADLLLRLPCFHFLRPGIVFQPVTALIQHQRVRRVQGEVKWAFQLRFFHFVRGHHQGQAAGVGQADRSHCCRFPETGI